MLNRVLTVSKNPNLHLTLNLLFLKLRKINEKKTVSPTRNTKGFSELRTSEFLRIETKIKPKKAQLSLSSLYESLQTVVKSLVLFNLKEGLSKEITEKNSIIDMNLRILIFNDDLLFDVNHENQEFIAALTYILWQIISK